MTIYFINRYFYPDHSATSQILTDLAFDLAKRGLNIHIIASTQRYDDPAANLPPYEIISGVTVHRVKTPQFGRSNLIGRAFDYLGFYFSATRKMHQLVSEGDILVAKTDPPLISILAAWIAKRKNALLINWLQDLFPEVAMALNVRGANSWFGRWLQKKRNQSLMQAEINIAIGERMAMRLKDNNIPENKITIIPNWANGNDIYPVDKHNNPLIEKWQLKNKFVIGYSGNLGRAHEINTILGSAEALQNQRDIVFLFIGGGTNKQRLNEAIKQRNLNNVIFKPYQPRDQLHYSLSVADIHLTLLNPTLEGLIVPSKYYGIAAANKPCIFIGDTRGEIAQTLHKCNGGMAIESGNSEQLTSAILHLQSSTNNNTSIRRYFETHLDQPVAIEKWHQTIINILNNP